MISPRQFAGALDRRQAVVVDQRRSKIAGRSEELAIEVDQAHGKVDRFFDVKRPPGATQGERHLFGNRSDLGVENLKRNRIDFHVILGRRGF
jgi:hypothetical protein